MRRVIAIAAAGVALAGGVTLSAMAQGNDDGVSNVPISVSSPSTTTTSSTTTTTSTTEDRTTWPSTTTTSPTTSSSTYRSRGDDGPTHDQYDDHGGRRDRGGDDHGGRGRGRGGDDRDDHRDDHR
ncbi:hypothetical protein [Lentzea sp. NPDC059081]|uniref:hypothetical protein n=1 Tax=Lentzea sp. NPDC059081 TaxID=3346719 RepID=UPI0036CCD2EF